VYNTKNKSLGDAAKSTISRKDAPKKVASPIFQLLVEINSSYTTTCEAADSII
jgi:hypothetical protein